MRVQNPCPGSEGFEKTNAMLSGSRRSQMTPFIDVLKASFGHCVWEAQSPKSNGLGFELNLVWKVRSPKMGFTR